MSDKDGLTDEERLCVELLTRPDTMTLEQWQASFPSVSRMGWRPIATAPMNETWILLYTKDEPPICVGRRELGRWACLCDDFRPTKPSHWMPLPEPPKE